MGFLGGGVGVVYSLRDVLGDMLRVGGGRGVVAVVNGCSVVGVNLGAALLVLVVALPDRSVFGGTACSC